MNRLRAESDSETDEFNAGFDAFQIGQRIEDAPETTLDMWRVGYAFAAFEFLKTENVRLRADAAELRRQLQAALEREQAQRAQRGKLILARDSD